MKRLFALILTLGLIGSVAYAHNGMEHVMGTVSAITGRSVTVTTTDGKSQTVAITPDTKYSKMNASITVKEIKVGDHVVIHATKKDNQLTAVTVKVGMDNMSGMKHERHEDGQQGFTTAAEVGHQEHNLIPYPQKG